ncbi:MAG TPA: DNA mismatch repair endonuclease MutL, partial [Thermoanaerobaculia bacterium]|nr:DNA mismatch repair endonuclease MutL [Thermoanaerobaculia bacterium]
MSSLPSLRAESRIRILASDLIDKIAAGEVVERPASVVKELVENSIDAGARSLRIDLVSGGKKKIEIADDGCGMSEEEATLAIRRHATSKISRFEDLATIRTLGFRGEALPSIASVSRFTLLTSVGEDGLATEVFVDSGREPEIRPAARDRGTTIRVEDLFENVPARQKFLKSADAEFRAIIAIISSYALTSPQRSFSVSHNGRMVLDLPEVESLRDRVLQVIGSRASRDLAPIELAMELGGVTGFVSREASLGSRRNQYFFVNGRTVRDRVLTHAATRAIEAFDDDRHPALVVFLDLDPDLVDVNVHPAKTEVRFRESGRIHVLVEQGIRHALGAPARGGSLLADGPAAPGHPSWRPGETSILSPPSFREGVPGGEGDFIAATPLFRERPLVQPPPPRFEPSTVGALEGRVIGQYRDSYILLDTPDGLRIVDQHVAHERVLYDRIEATLGEKGEVQRLLEPLIHETGAAESALLDSHLEELRGLGFEIERFSGNSFAIAAVPTLLRRESVSRFLARVIDAAAEEKGSHAGRVRAKIIASLACQAAIKVHRPLSGDEMSGLVADLLRSSNPYACPHGRPIIVDIRHLDVEKHFHR